MTIRRVTPNYVAGSMEAALRMPETRSERHPDVFVYLRPPPVNSRRPWDDWVPNLVVEVVSKSSRQRDYKTKREDYLRAGVREYWIVDPFDRCVTQLTRRGDS